jgi:HEAT repeat protein
MIGTSILRLATRYRKGIGIVFLLAVSCHTKSPTEGKTVAEFEAILRTGDATTQAQAALGLAKLGPVAAGATPALVEALSNPNQLVRQNAALALGEIGPEAKSAVPALTTALSDSTWEVRRAAAVSLGKLGPEAKSATAALEKLTADRNSLVQKAAREALRQVKGRE